MTILQDDTIKEEVAIGISDFEEHFHHRPPLRLGRCDRAYC